MTNSLGTYYLWDFSSRSFASTVPLGQLCLALGMALARQPLLQCSVDALASQLTGT